MEDAENVALLHHKPESAAHLHKMLTWQNFARNGGPSGTFTRDMVPVLRALPGNTHDAR